MEPLKKISSEALSGGFLFGAVLFFGVLPLITSMSLWLSDFDSTSLNYPFFVLTARSILFTSLHSLLTATIVIIIGSLIAVGVFLFKGKTYYYLSTFVSSFGYFSFVLPGVSVALLVLSLSQKLSVVPSQGLLAILCAHIILNLFFFTAQLQTRIQNFFSSQGRRFFEAGLSLGASPHQSLINTLSPIIKNEANVWWPMIFYWSFNAFSTTLILAGKPYYSSPEVLLYYSLQNNFSSGRVLFLVLLNILIAFVLYLFLMKNRQQQRSSLSFSNIYSWSPTDKCRSFTIYKSIGCIAVLIWICVLGFGVLSPLFHFLIQNSPPSEIVSSFKNSLVLAFFTAVFSCLFAGALFMSPQRIRGLTYFLSLLMSPTLLAAIWIGFGLDFWLLNKPYLIQIGVCAFLISLAQVSLTAIWVDMRLLNRPKNISWAGATLGAKPSQIFLSLTLPLNRDLFIKVGGLAFLLGLGDIALSTLLLQDVEFAAGLSRVLALRYDYSASRWLLTFILLTSIIISLFSLVGSKGSKTLATVKSKSGKS